MRLHTFPVDSYGLGTLAEVQEELTHYAEVLLGKAELDIDGTSAMALLEVSSAYLARAYDIERRILDLERTRNLPKGSPSYNFRTGQLQSFIEMARTLRDLGSRRLTFARLQFDMREESAS